MEAALGVALPSLEDCQLSLLVTNDETVRRLNRDFRGLDEVTDVLSFSTVHSGPWEGAGGFPEATSHQETQENVDPFVYPPEESLPLGEIIISLPQAQRQATAAKKHLDQELALLIVHGVLHLAGHDHMEPQETGEMQAKEKSALKSIRRLEIPPMGTLSR